MDVILVVWFCVCTTRTVLGSGMDPDLQMDIITELDLVNTTLGVTKVSGLHNASKALLFQDTEREIHAAPHVSEKLIQLFRNKSDFTFLATVQQKPSTSGVILSIRELEHRYASLLLKICFGLMRCTGALECRGRSSGGTFSRPRPRFC